MSGRPSASKKTAFEEGNFAMSFSTARSRAAEADDSGKPASAILAAASQCTPQGSFPYFTTAS